MPKYKYVGNEPALLIEYHKEVNPNDVIEVPVAIDNVFFIPVDDAKPEKKSSAKSGEQEADSN